MNDAWSVAEIVQTTISGSTLLLIVGVARKIFRMEHRLELCWNDLAARKKLEDGE